jgi:PST family polysaccharide transporter/lipopolysaccharide exporter
MQGSGIISVLVGIGAAFFLHNVWALLIAYVTEAVLRLLLSFIFCPFLPRLKFNLEYTRDILNFSKKMFGLPILMMLFVQTDVFVIGKVLSVSLLGMYSLARGLAEMPAMLAVKIIHPIALPALSTMQDEKVRLNNTFLSITRTIATFGIPLFSFFILFSGQILSIAYGTAYRIVAIPFGILSMYSFFLICSSLIMVVYISIGRPDIHRTASLIRTVLFLIIIYPATVSFGLVGSSTSLLLSALLLLAAQMVYLNRILNIHVTEYFQTWIVGIKLSIIVIMPGILLQVVDYSHTVVSVVIGISCCLVAWGLGAIRLGWWHSLSSSTEPIS